MFITDLERRAARLLGLEKPWLYAAKPLDDCPVCAEKIKHGVAVCKSCGAILDREKAAQYGLGGHEDRATVRRK
jgi:RNA polymerase subunit RPABC4/transcription elongation factor Spt4